MFETLRSFSDYIRDYDLQRAEALLLRHLNSVYKVLDQTVPDPAKNDAIVEMELYLRTMIRQVDSSLLDEWEKMRDPKYQLSSETKEVRPPGAEEAQIDITRDHNLFLAAVRNRIFSFLRGLVNSDFKQALAHLSSTLAPEGQTWTVDRLREIRNAYDTEHQQISLDPNARNLRHTYVIPSEDQRIWRIQQMLIDPDEHNDWVAEFAVDLAESRRRAEPVLALNRIGSL